MHKCLLAIADTVAVLFSAAQEGASIETTIRVLEQKVELPR